MIAPNAVSWDIAGLIPEQVTPPQVRTMARTWCEGRPDQVGEVRRLVAGLLPSTCPPDRAGDVQLCVSELLGNAVLHSRSGAPGGLVLVTADVGIGYITITVADQGPALVTGLPRGEGEGGRGLAIVAGLADGYVVTTSPGGGRSVWIRLTWTETAR